MIEFKKNPTPDEMQEEYNASLSMHRKPPPPRYSPEMIEKMKSEQHLFRCPVVIYTHPDHNVKIKVSANDSQKRLELSGKGWKRLETPETPAEDSVTVSGSTGQGMPEDLNSMKKKDILDLARKLGIPTTGTMEELKAAIEDKRSE